MEFRLVYQGPLFANGSPAHKHDVRKQFHPQLRRLWQTHPALKFMIDNGIATLTANRESPSCGIVTLDEYADMFKAGNFRFVPLVAKCFATACCLDILLLRPDRSDPLVSQAGDVDNRIKTPFDALRIPEPDEVKGLTPADGEDPFFCLLEDDALIVEFHISADRLLVLPAGAGHWENHAHVVLTITLKLVRSVPLSQAFL